MRMNDWCFGPRLCTARLNWPETTWANEMNFDMNHALGTGSIARTVGSSPARYHYTTDASLGKE